MKKSNVSSKHVASALAELTHRAETSFASFCRQAWHVVEPVTPLIWGWHLDAIAEHLQAVTAGDIRNLVINIGPGHMKSLMVSVFWTAWEWLKRPDCRYLFSSYAAPLSIRDNLKCRRLIKSPWYQARWSGVYELTADQDAKTRYENNKTGYRIATSVGGYATGERCNRAVVDDPHNVKDRESEAKREAALTWWDESMSTRLNDPRADAKIIIQQRVHEKDLTGHVLKQGGYEHLFLPTEFEPERRCVTSIGWVDPRTEQAELLFPKRFGPDEVKEAKLRLGPYGYAGQHQQAPAPAGGGRFKAGWFRYFKTEGDFYVLYRTDGTIKSVPINKCDRFGMMDPAGLEKDQGDKPCYTVIQVWAVTPDFDMLLLHQYREMVETPTAADAAIDQKNRWELPWVGVEKNGLGLGVMQSIRKRGVTVKPILARGSKEARSETAEIRMAAAMVYFPQGAPWLFDLETELTRFPNSEFKDQVDALAHSAIYVQNRGGAPTSDGDTSRSAVADQLDAQAEAAIEGPSPPATPYYGDDDGNWIGYDDD